MTSNEEMIIYEDSVLLVEEDVKHQVPLVHYIKKLGDIAVPTCLGSPRLPKGCILFRSKDSGQASFRCQMLIYIPEGKRILRYARRVDEPIYDSAGNHIDNRRYNESTITGEVYLPPIVFKLSFDVETISQKVITCNCCRVYTQRPNMDIGQAMSLRAANLPNVKYDSGEICFGSNDPSGRGKSIEDACNEYIDIFFNGVGNDDYNWCVPYNSFPTWIERSKNSTHASVLAEYEKQAERNCAYDPEALINL